MSERGPDEPPPRMLGSTYVLAQSVGSRLSELERVISRLSRENAAYRQSQEELSRERQDLVDLLDRAELLRHEHTDLLTRSQDTTRRLQASERARAELERSGRALVERCTTLEAALAEASAQRRVAEEEAAVLVRVVAELRAIVALLRGAGEGVPVEGARFDG